MISPEELEKGLDDLGIFDNIPKWKKQLPAIVKKFDSSGDGNVSLPEFFKFLGVQDYAPNIIQRMTKVFALAAEKLSIEDIFKELDTDGGGSIDADELRSGIIRIKLFNDISKEDSQAVVAKFDTDGDGKISMREFVDFFSQRLKQAQIERKKKRQQLLAKRFQALVHAAVAKGANLSQMFSHFDKDSGGFISPKELATGLKSIKQFDSLTDQDIDSLVEILDADRSGDISLDEFKAFIGEAAEKKDVGEDSSYSGSANGGVGQKFLTAHCEKLRKIINTAIKNGLTLEKIFAHADSDRSGELNLDELRTILNKFKSFEGIPISEVEAMMSELDSDRSGTVSIAEFRLFLDNSSSSSSRSSAKDNDSSGKIRSGPGSSSGAGAGPSSSSSQSRPSKDSSTLRELFTRHMLRIAESDGGLEGLLAYLDDDEDGLIPTATLTRLLRREGVFESIDESEIRKLLTQFQKGGDDHLSVVVLLRFLEGRDSASQIPLVPDEEEDLKMLADDYTFSNDLEIRALEKKIRQVGRTLARKGVDIESLFKQFDVRESGMIRRTEFIEALTRIGLYVLEKGKVLEASADEDGSSGSVKRLQMAQISRLKGHNVSDSKHRNARRSVMNAGEEMKTDFVVRCYLFFILLFLS